MAAMASARTRHKTPPRRKPSSKTLRTTGNLSADDIIDSSRESSESSISIARKTHFHEARNDASLTEAEEAAERLYRFVAEQTNERPDFTPTTISGKQPARSPYSAGVKYGKGALFAPKFREFVESGGVAAHKNAVVANIRLNDLRDIQSLNGDGHFKVSFFLDTAFWVPAYDHDHFKEQYKTLGKFSDYEPNWEFPEVDEDAGLLTWVRRTAEFSKDVKNSRRHEVQLGQNYETVVNAPSSALNKLKNHVLSKSGKSALPTTRKIFVSDPQSHWPRLWRVSINDEEIKEMGQMDKKERKSMEPTNEKPRQMHERMRKLFTTIDKTRDLQLSVPNEGIVFATYEITAEHRNKFALHEFPFDMHDLKIIVRLGKRDHDVMNRYIVPVGHDKGFFVSSRVQKMVDYHLARNLDWEVTREPMSYGGLQRLNASAIVRRKPGYYIRNYLLVIFFLTTTTFVGFGCRPDDMNSRVTVIFTALLSIVAFKYSGTSRFPQVPYPTILDSYIVLNFYVCLGVGLIQIILTFQCTSSGNVNEKFLQENVLCNTKPGIIVGMPWFPAYSAVFEICVAILCFIGWVGANIWYWHGLYARIRTNLDIIDEVGLGWMNYKTKNKAMKGKYDAWRLISTEKPSESPPPETKPKSTAGPVSTNQFMGLVNAAKAKAAHTGGGTPKAKASDAGKHEKDPPEGKTELSTAPPGQTEAVGAV